MLEEETFGDDGAIEIVDHIEFDEPMELVPAPPENGDVARMDADPVAPELEAAAPDAYAGFLGTLAEAARAIGESAARDELRDRFEAALRTDGVAAAWAAILRGEGEDFSVCGTPLDEWAAATAAGILGAPHKAAQLRRELRARGVAAFGLIQAA
ncbi:MAG TPA: hypothetical protein VGI39_13435 [Polyangiaceae bacterium]